jgi:hypothetical protein
MLFLSEQRCEIVGQVGAGREAGLGRVSLTLASLSAIALRRYVFSYVSDGRSLTDVSLPNWPMSSSELSPNTSLYSQKRKLPCCLEAAMIHVVTPRWLKNGMLPLILSSTSGQALWISARRCSRIG